MCPHWVLHLVIMIIDDKKSSRRSFEKQKSPVNSPSRTAFLVELADSCWGALFPEA